MSRCMGTARDWVLADASWSFGRVEREPSAPTPSGPVGKGLVFLWE